MDYEVSLRQVSPDQSYDKAPPVRTAGWQTAGWHAGRQASGWRAGKMSD